ncbi:MAG: hypothetical protein Q9159_001603 [Coniocarpon cinnabarinum]
MSGDGDCVPKDGDATAAPLLPEYTKPASASEHGIEPFFVLVHDKRTGEFHHPHVHYIFQDDEPDRLTNAVLDNLEWEPSNIYGAAPSSPAEAEEITLVVDLSSDGQQAKAAKSLSSQWQPSGVQLSEAPTFDQEASGATMIVIEGEHVAPPPQRAYDLVLPVDQAQISTADRIELLSTRLGLLAEEYDRGLESLGGRFHRRDH